MSIIKMSLGIARIMSDDILKSKVARKFNVQSYIDSFLYLKNVINTN